MFNGNTDNQNIICVLDRGSRKQDLHSLVEAVIESSNTGFPKKTQKLLKMIYC